VVLAQISFETLIYEQGLAVALVVVFVGFFFWLIKHQQHTIENHIAHNSEIMSAVKSAVDAQTEATKELTRYIQTRDGP